MNTLSGQVAIVTGGSRGIGRAICEELSGAGCRVAVVATSESGAQGCAEALIAAGGEASAHAADVRDAARANAVVAEVLARWGRLDILVNNAGITRDNLLMRMSDEDIDAVIDVDLKGVLYWCRAAIRPMLKARAGAMINVSSIVGLTGNAGQSNYSAAKAGVYGVTRSLAQELGGRGVRVNAVAPGYIATDMTSGLPEEVRSASLARIPLGRLGEPRDIARAVRFLASPDAAYITGATLVVDGGMSL